MNQSHVSNTLTKAYELQVCDDIFERVMEASQFFRGRVSRWATLSAQDDLFKAELLLQWCPTFEKDMSEQWLSGQLQAVFTGEELSGPEGRHRLMARLRFVRELFQVRAIYREYRAVGRPFAVFLGQMQEYSVFAKVVFQQTEKHLRAELAQAWGVALPPALIVLGLGKLGAGELNLSSDVDLIFAYDYQIMLQGPRDKGAAEFYTRLGQALIKVLGDVTGDGFVFRVDMRLRPFGQSGALVWSTRALETYYVQQGRMWERYAWIKTQPLTGGEAALALLRELSPFVYRRYVDFSVIQSLREMKTLIEREVNRKEANDDIKIGRGGIREVEFVVQVVQLIRGGELSELREASLMKAMDAIVLLGILPSRVVEELRRDYIFLRRIEHFLQSFDDRQTQTLPTSKEQWQALTDAMCFASPRALLGAVNDVRDRIHHHFQQTIRPPSSDRAMPGALVDWQGIWPDRLEQIESVELQELLQGLADSRFLAKASDISQKRLRQLMPMILSMLHMVSDEAKLAKEATLSHQLQVSLPELELCWAGASKTLQRFLAIIESILRRSAYISLLIENPRALYQVLKVCGMSAFLPVKLARYPSLLDEFVDDEPMHDAPTRDQLIDELRQQLVRVPEDDFEQQMARLRAFKQRHTLKAAMADIAGQLPLMKVSDYLTWLAEALLQAALDIAWRKLTLKYGEPCLKPGASTGFLIVGYGKLGGLELSYSSDLDIVFLYDAQSGGETEGPRVIENSMFYIQLVKNLNHILMTDTLDGRLYEIDMRLRPSGSAGLLVSTFESFAKYQERDAWVWERQAIVRARPVAGDFHLYARFHELRIAGLEGGKKDGELTQSVLEMRERMRNHLQDNSGRFDLKYSVGGLVDIEFLAQHLVLSYAQSHPMIAKYPDNVRIFEQATLAGVLSEADSDALTHAYLLYRALIHRLSLQNLPLIVDKDLLPNARQSVDCVFSRWFKLEEEGEWE